LTYLTKEGARGIIPRAGRPRNGGVRRVHFLAFKMGVCYHETGSKEGAAIKTVILTDSKYRSAISAARSLGKAGWRVVAVQTRGDAGVSPPVFSSRYVSESRWLEGVPSDAEYAARLTALLTEYERPVLFPVGAATLNAVSRAQEQFQEHCDFLIASPEVLDAVNDKQVVHRRALELGLPVPREYEGAPERYPVIVKPRCGEKFGLKAKDRYAVAENEAQLMQIMERMRSYDPRPVVQEVVTGDGYGASLLMGRDGELLDAFCHRRIREYPVTGGPSTCCESVWEPEKVEIAAKLLRSFGFAGLAMVEFKGDHILEVNPRIWGSFPLTAQAGSQIAVRCVRAAAGEEIAYTPCDYRTGVLMRFTLNDTLATLSLLRSGQLRKALAGVGDMFRVREALRDRDDPAPLRAYFKSVLLRK